MSYDLIRSQSEFHTHAYIMAPLYQLATKYGFVEAQPPRDREGADDDPGLPAHWWIPVEDVANLAKTLRRALEDLELQPERVDLDSIEEEAKSWIRSPRGKEYIKTFVSFCEDSGLLVLG